MASQELPVLNPAGEAAHGGAGPGLRLPPHLRGLERSPVEQMTEAAEAAGVSPEPSIPEDAAEDVRPLWAALCEVRDPELPVSIVDLGLIYGVRRNGRRVHVEMTFTAIACPCMLIIQDDVRDRLLEEADVDAVDIDVVWDPPWTRDRMTEKGKAILRNYGVAA